ncbi:MerR family transcriptional regulator [Pseudoalteromonas byunsanensis]|uniref:Transcriptional regulator n=1 Tax=Pseudoalteromonas byunsanensis TaxID=327939 RepID=A0A1S1N9H9_9GAMM|nr:MerR family transcriptional regulator [Pseudoalteromonas byunsanensis]OHU96024.1 transcriptional regulator [Pseudoalteromonas byunsanensis]
MFIGEVARQTGLSVKAIRFYEQKGLIKKPLRQGRYRVYTASDVEVLKLIREAKELGVTLAKLKGVIVYQNDQVDWERINLFLQQLKIEMQEQVLRISNNIAKVSQCIRTIESCPKVLDSAVKGRA